MASLSIPSSPWPRTAAKSCTMACILFSKALMFSRSAARWRLQSGYGKFSQVKHRRRKLMSQSIAVPTEQMTILDQAVTSQRSQALQKANRVRLAQARLQEEMADGRLSFAQALVDPRAQQMTTEKILLAIKGVGGWRVSSRLSEAEISP